MPEDLPPMAYIDRDGGPKPPDWYWVLSESNREALQALASAYGISEVAVLNVAVSDAADAKLANMRDALGE